MERALKHKQSIGNTQEQVEEEEAKWYMVFDIIRARELSRNTRERSDEKKKQQENMSFVCPCTNRIRFTKSTHGM